MDFKRFLTPNRGIRKLAGATRLPAAILIVAALLLIPAVGHAQEQEQTQHGLSVARSTA